MAGSEHLPIYKASYDLYLWFDQIVRNLSLYHKFGLGTDLRDGARKVLRLIVRAHERRDKVLVPLEIRETVEELKVLLRLGHDSQALPSFKSFEHAVGLVTDIVRQNEGWQKSQREGRGQNRRVILDEIAEPSAP